MYTQCPECLSVFSLDAHTIAQAHAHVTCGHCDAGFDSLATLTDQLPPEPFDELPLNEPAFEPPRIELVIFRPPTLASAVTAAEATDATAATHDDFSQLVFAPRFAREHARLPVPGHAPTRARRPRTGERRWPWIAVCLLLMTLLGAQLAWAERDPLIRDRTVGAWLRDACGVLGCRLPLIAAPEQLHLLASNVQAHPSVRGALMISASVQNDAAFAQPYPVLTITLSDAQGKRIAMRRLQPVEYLDDDAIRRRGLAAGASAVLLLEVADPGDRAVGFEFEFE
jgi:predicted Zn finger-like uncharacterized protein